MWMASSGWCSMTTRPAWRCIAPARSTAAHRAGGLCARRTWRRSRSHPRPGVPGFPVQRGGSAPHAHRSAPFNDVRVRRAISHAIDRQGLIEAVSIGASRPLPLLPAWRSGRCPSTNSAQERSTISTIKEARACSRKPDIPRALKRRSRLQLAMGVASSMWCSYTAVSQRRGREAVGKSSRNTARIWPRPCSASTRAWCMVLCPLPGNRMAHCIVYAPDSPPTAATSTTPHSRPCSRNSSTKDLETHKKLVFDIQRYVAEQQYYVYTNSSVITGTWQPLSTKGLYA